MYMGFALIAAFFGVFLLVASVPFWRWFLTLWCVAGSGIAFLFLRHAGRPDTGDPLAQMIDEKLLKICVLAWILALLLQFVRASAVKRGWAGYCHALALIVGVVAILIASALRFSV